MNFHVLPPFQMTEAELRKHREEYEIFQDGAGAKKTYMEVREQLRLRELSRLIYYTFGSFEIRR